MQQPPVVEEEGQKWHGGSKECRTEAQLLRGSGQLGKFTRREHQERLMYPDHWAWPLLAACAGESLRLGLHLSKARGTFLREGSDSGLGVFCALRSSQ